MTATKTRKTAPKAPAAPVIEAEAPNAPRTAWHALMYLITTQVLEGERWHRGTAIGIDETGALRVATEGGERRFHSGEVSVRRT